MWVIYILKVSNLQRVGKKFDFASNYLKKKKKNLDSQPVVRIELAPETHARYMN